MAKAKDNFESPTYTNKNKYNDIHFQGSHNKTENKFKNKQRKISICSKD